MKPAERKKLDALETRIHAMLDRGEALAWDVGKAFDAIARGGMHLDAGYPTLEAYADDRFEEGYRTLKRDRRVALAFARRTVVKYGTTKLDLALTYMAATPEHERAAEIDRLAIRLPVGKKLASVPFGKASVSQLEKAIKHRAALPTAHDDAKEARAKRRAHALQRAVAAPRGKHEHAPLVRAHVTDDGHLRFDVVGIDESDLGRVARALLAQARATEARSRTSPRS